MIDFVLTHLDAFDGFAIGIIFTYGCIRLEKYLHARKAERDLDSLPSIESATHRIKGSRS